MRFLMELRLKETAATRLKNILRCLFMILEFVTYNFWQLANLIVRFVREKLNMPMISRGIRSLDDWERARVNSDQIIFEGFNFDLN